MIRTTARRQGGVWLSLLKGVLLAVAVTLVLVAVFALVISLFSVPDGVVRGVNQGIKLLAIVLGVRAAVSRGGEGGILRGALVGLAYMAVGVLVYALLTAQKLSAVAYLADLLLGVAAGGLTGMARGK